MGWYINYEVKFDEFVDWDDTHVKHCLKSFNVNFMNLRDHPEMIIIISMYSQHNISDILDVLYDIYFTDMTYRQYGILTWNKYK